MAKKIDEDKIVNALVDAIPNVPRAEIRHAVKQYKKLAEKEDIFCNFCGREQREIQKMICGPKVFICNECVDDCYAIVHPEVKNDEA